MYRWSRFISVLAVILVLSSSMLVTGGQVQAGGDFEAITGSVSLPSGHFAPEGGLMVHISNGEGASTVVTIPAEANSIEYSLLVPAGVQRYISYSLLSYEGHEYVRSAAYGQPESTTFMQEATPVQSGETGVNLTILAGRTISGTIVLPEGIDVPEHGVGFNVVASRTDENFNQWANGMFTPSARSLPFVITVPAGEGFVIGYSLHDSFAGLVRRGYYSAGGIVGLFQQAHTFNLTAENAENIIITPVVGRTISGHISLPNDVAPPGGLDIHIHGNYGAGGTNVFIPSGHSGADFTMEVLPGEYWLRYNIHTSQSAYAQSAYYHPEGNVLQEMGAYIIDVSETDRADINITLLGTVAIEGTVSLPAGVLATTDIEVQVRNDMGGSDFVTILNGQNSASYVLPTAPHSTTRVYYVLYPSESESQGFVRHGYYTDSGTIARGWNVTNVNVGHSGAQNINLTLIPGQAITGQIRLPQGHTAPYGGLHVQIDNEQGAFTHTRILENQNSEAYTLVVPLGDSYRIAYNISQQAYPHNDYVRAAYYGGAFTSTFSQQAILVSPGASEINLTIMPGRTISGTISLPPDFVFSSPSSLRFSIHSRRSNERSQSFNSEFTPSTRSVPFVVTVPEGEGFALEYSLQSTVGGLVRNGYYSSSGIVGSWHQAELLDLTSDNITGKDITLVPGRTISGRISLPDQDVAPPGGLDIWIGGVNSSGVNAFVPQGGRYADYNLVLVPGEFLLRYNINTPQSTYVRSGFYSSSGTVLREEEASVVDVREGDSHDVNLTLARSVLINGTVSLPEGLTATTNMQVHINNNRGSSVSVTIPAGGRSVPYQLPVEPGTTHTVNYSLGEGPQYAGLVRMGYYSQAGATTTFNNQIGHVESDSTGIDLEIIRGRIISGTIALPANYTVSGNGVQVQVAAGRNHEFGHGHSVTLTESSPVAAFSLTVPEGMGYGVWYTVTAPGLVGHAYYVSPTAVGTWEHALGIDVGDEDVTGINMSLVAGKAVSGRISLPDGVLAPAGGIRAGVNSGGNWASVLIPGGQNGANYTLVLGEGLHRIQYHLQNNYSGFLRVGYYGGQQTVSRHDEAAFVDTTDDNINEIADINLTIIRAVTVTGTIVVPDGPATSTLRLHVNNNQGASTNVTIPAGASSVEYTLSVAPQSEHIISYRFESGSLEFIGQGFYSNAGTVTAYRWATAVAVEGDGVSGIDLTLLRGAAISGTISLPSGRVAPSGGLRVEINDNEGLSTWFTILANANSVQYSFVVAEGGPYRIRYGIPDWVYRGTEYVRQGYYSTSGTTIFHDQATALMVSGPLSNIDLTIMEGYTISGTVRLPNVVAPAGGLHLFISNSEGAWTTATIPAGQSQVPYNLTVAPGSYRVSYSLSDAPTHLNLISRGYYGGSSLYHEAELVDVTMGSVTGRDMVIGTGVTVSGNISLPQGFELTSRLRIQMSNNEGAWASVTMDPHQASVPYSLVVPPGVLQHIRYHISSFDYVGNDLVRDGYYSDQGTTPSYQDARPITPVGNLSGINLTILAPQVLGTVRAPAPDNFPVSHGWVQIQGATGQHITSVGITNHGHFSLGGLEAGDYTLRAFPSHGSSFAPSEQVPFTISQGQASPVVLTVTLSPVQLQIVASGTSHGWVEILRRDGQVYSWYAGMGLNRAGIGFIGGLSDGHYRFRVFPGNSGDICASLPIDFEVTNGITSPGVIVVELQLPQVYGVLHGPDGLPVAGGWVRLSDSTGQYVTGVGVDRNGRFALAGLEAGMTYRLRGYSDDRTGYTPSGEVPISTDTETSSDNRLVVTLTSAQITGSVFIPGGASPRGWVEVRDSNGRWVTSSGINRQGRYNIGGLEPGSYVIQAMAPGDVEDYTNGAPVAVTVPGETMPLTVNLTMRGVALTGSVSIPPGVVPSSVWVEVGDSAVNWLYTFSVDASGNFKLPALDFGEGKTYVIKAFAPGYESPQDVINSLTETNTITLQLEAKQ